MADYKAGDLNLSIQTISNDTIKSLDAVIERLSLIQKGLGTMSGFARGGKPFIRKSTSGSRTEKTYSVGKHGKEYLTLSKDIQRAEKSLKTITTQFDRQGKVLKKTTVDVDEYGNKITKIFGGGKKTSNNGGLFGLGKLGINIYLLRRMGRGVANLVQAGSDYTETLNLWQVAMRDNLDTADQFINKMQKAYGISSKTLMNAQAVFKNMIGSLGQISDATAYALSEALVQMSADYASLYNRTLESAFQNMQSMLAGQVRPIRSAGLDMTETTLFMFYQQLGGTKTMRQLNRTEKQLLSILAVYQQMGSAGALGDMSKTLNQFANQSRMMTEYWQELKTWSGLILKDWFDTNEILVKVNAALITITEIVKAIAKSRGLGEENFIDGIFETTEATNDEIDELQGKLLDFDKFRSLEGASASPLAIDEKLLEAITGYSSKIDQAQNAAQKLAETWLKFWINEETGGLTEDAERVLGILEGLVKFTTILIGLKVGGWLLGFVKGITSLTVASKGLNTILLAGVIYVIWEAIDAFREGDTVAGIIAITIGVALVGALVAFKLAQNKAAIATQFLTAGIQQQNVFMQAQGLTMAKTSLSIKSVGVALMAMVASYGVASLVINQFEGTGKKIASWAFIVVGAITAVTAALVAMNTAITWGTMLPVLLAGVGAAIAGVQGLMPEVQMAAVGASNLDSGTLFVAGEMGKTEAVYTGSNGKTNVANIQQMKTAYSQALNEFWRSARNDIPAFQGVSDSGIYTIVDGEAKRRGKKFANV